MSLLSVLQYTISVLFLFLIAYVSILGLMIVFPSLQAHLFYLHHVRQTHLRDLDTPEIFGFLHNQVTAFHVKTPDHETLYAWHILPIGVYARNQKDLSNQPAAFAEDVISTLAFQLLRDDPNAGLVIYLHGTAGTVASGYRPDCYRNLYAGAPSKIHVLTADYRGFGRSSGFPSEEGLLLDALSLVRWATDIAGIPASRIVLFCQSLGTAVGISVVRHLAMQPQPICFAGVVLVASFSDVANLMETYRIDGKIPVLSLLRHVPQLMIFFNGFIKDTWLTNVRLAEFIGHCEGEASIGQYHLSFVHAEDDPIIPSFHSDALFSHAVKASAAADRSCKTRAVESVDLGAGGRVFIWRSAKGVIRQFVLRTGVHDKLMAYPAISLAILQAFQTANPNFGDVF
ncbi:hypothetical protein MMC21_001451 [Puttea exsequens]|nr:hypothetical protein [Puttea exsequens]